tara:strand:- start:887 stop:1351 length:465 start_codon:yes stop_codon:yes gene_type:complete
MTLSFLKKFYSLVFIRPKSIHLNKKHNHASDDNTKNENIRKLKTLVWIDDKLNPMDPRMDWLAYSPVGREVKVIWVKNILEFKKWVQNNGLPCAICFDYDLGENNPSGFDCAKWLVNYCQNNQLALPLWASQSPNPEGKARINRFLRNFDTQSQ